MVRQPLGRGLSALLGDESAADNIREIDIDQVEPNSEQPRTRFADDALDELGRSIAANGIVQPIVVRRREAGYQIVAGERRWRAAQRIGLRRIPIVVRDVSDDKLLEIALVENIQRQELNAVEEARAFRKLIDTIGLTQEIVAERVGKERSLITTSLRLLKLPDDILKLIEDKKLSAGHGRALLLTDDSAVQRRAAKLIVEMSLSVRDAEKLIRRNERTSEQTIEKAQVRGNKDANMIAAETKLRRRLGTNVNILPNKNGKSGKLEIEYYSMDDLDRIYQMIVQSNS